MQIDPEIQKKIKAELDKALGAANVQVHGVQIPEPLGSLVAGALAKAAGLHAGVGRCPHEAELEQMRRARNIWRACSLGAIAGIAAALLLKLGAWLGN